MSSDDLVNKEKSCVINLDSDSDFDRKSLAKSIEINYLENQKLEESSLKETGVNKNLDEEQIKTFNFTCNKQEKSFEKEGLINSSNAESGFKKSDVNIDNEEENLLIFENPSDFKSLFNCSKFVEDYNLNKNNSVETHNSNNYNLFRNKMRRSENSKIDYNKNITENGNFNNNNNNKTGITLLLHKVESLDKYFSLMIHDLHLSRNFDFFFYIFARLFNPDFISSYFLFILSYKIYSDNDYYFVFKPMASTVFCLAITLFLKKHFGRRRPDYSKKSKRIFDLRKLEKNCSMPSGDSLQAGNFSIILFLYFNSTIGFTIIPFVMFARVYFYCHFILDTIVGAILGIFLSTLVYYFINLY